MAIPTLPIEEVSAMEKDIIRGDNIDLIAITTIETTMAALAITIHITATMTMAIVDITTSMEVAAARMDTTIVEPRTTIIAAKAVANNKALMDKEMSPCKRLSVHLKDTLKSLL